MIPKIRFIWSLPYEEFNQQVAGIKKPTIEKSESNVKKAIKLIEKE